MESVVTASEFAFGALQEAAKTPLVTRLFQPKPLPVLDAPGLAAKLEQIGEAGTRFVTGSQGGVEGPVNWDGADWP